MRKKFKKYRVSVVCRNCGAEERIDISKGTLIKNVKCSTCGTKSLEKRMWPSPIETE